MQLDPQTQQTIAELAKLGGQYFLPVAALLRALYAGIRGKFPEGLSQIALASMLAGVTAVVGEKDLDFKGIVLNVFGNTVFMAGLLSFIMAYLLRQPNRGYIVDAIVGGILGLIVFVVWTLILGNEWPWWTFPLAIMAGAGGFVVLRSLLRQIARLVRIATFFISIGVLFLVGAGGVLLFQTVMTTVQGITGTPTPTLLP
jgi:hypothetical protein